MSHEWVPYVKSRGSNYQCAPESALNHHEADGGTTSPLHPRWRGAVSKANYCLVKNMTLKAARKGVSLNMKCWSSTRWRKFLAPLTLENQHSMDHGCEVFPSVKTIKLLCCKASTSKSPLPFALHPPSAWWCVFAVFAFSLNGKKHTCINKCLSMIQTLSLIL